MRDLTIRALIWLRHRARPDDRGLATAEVLMYTAGAVGILAFVVLPRMEGIVGGVLDSIESNLP